MYIDFSAKLKLDNVCGIFVNLEELQENLGY